MARVTENMLLNGLSGTIGKQLTCRQIGGRTFVSKLRGPSTVAPTDKLIKARTKFSVATAYAKMVVKTPSKKTVYQSAIQGGQRAFNVAIKDAMNAPVVHAINSGEYLGRAGDPIFIHATDDFKVETVFISILTASGELLEQGYATMKENNTDWFYSAQKINGEKIGTTIAVTATDLPGNSTTLRIVL